jgi:hypothetical protein
MVTLLHGGQSASLVTSRLGKLGWKQDNGALVGPSALGGSEVNALYVAGPRSRRTSRTPTCCHGSVTSIGGQNIVQWQAGTPRRADQILRMYLIGDLPALPYCAKLPKAAQSRVIGCP